MPLPHKKTSHLQTCHVQATSLSHVTDKKRKFISNNNNNNIKYFEREQQISSSITVEILSRENRTKEGVKKKGKKNNYTPWA